MTNEWTLVVDYIRYTPHDATIVFGPFSIRDAFGALDWLPRCDASDGIWKHAGGWRAYVYFLADGTAISNAMRHDLTRDFPFLERVRWR